MQLMGCYIPRIDSATSFCFSFPFFSPSPYFFLVPLLPLLLLPPHGLNTGQRCDRFAKDEFEEYNSSTHPPHLSSSTPLPSPSPPSFFTVGF